MIILIASFTVAVSVSDLGLIMSLVGSTGSIIVSYILPGLCYYYSFTQTSSENFEDSEINSLNSSIGGGNSNNHGILKVVALLQCGFGILLIPLCIALSFWS